MFERISAVCLALAALAGGARADPPRKLWELASFDAPKSVLYDARTDSYFVSNVNGYISQVSGDGRPLHRIWFPGLNAPKGMAIYGNYLFVADIDQFVVIGNLDGLEPIGDGRFLATDWVAGGLLLLDKYGRPQVLADLPQGTGDIGFNPLLKQLVVPLMADGRIVAYQFD